MIRFAVFYLAVGAVANQIDRFSKWKSDYSRSYGSEQEERERFAIWSAAVERTGAAALSPFTDRTTAEYRAAFPKRAEARVATDDYPHFPFTPFSDAYVADALATAVDWRALGAVTACKSQGAQGDCGTFGQTQEAESQFFLGGGGANPTKRPHALTQFSEQQIMSCSGDHQDAYLFFEVGLESTASYPYNATNWPTNDPPPCLFDARKVIPESVFSNWTSVPAEAGEEQLAAFVLHNGPVQIGIDADVFSRLDADHHITAENCGEYTSIDHSLGIVGYNTSEEKGDYWILKNSWGGVWQDHGFLYLARGAGCGNVFASGAHVYTYGNPKYYYEQP